MDEDAGSLARWVEHTIGGRAIDVRRLRRWRPAWDVDVEVDGRIVELHARGEREPDIVMPYRIDDEVRTHDLLEAHGIPVPHAYGICDDPHVLVMDRLAGQVDLSSVSDAQRAQLLDEYLEILARIYSIPVEAAATNGFAVPADPVDTALGGYWRPMLEQYDERVDGLPPDPVAVFLRRWMDDNAPRRRDGQARFITYDSFQFMFTDGGITGLLDFEHAHVGDPMMDLAALRIRDTIKNIGELSDTAVRYEQVTGIPIDHEVVEYHSVLYNAISVISTGPPLHRPRRGVDWISYLAWYVNGARWAFECIAELRGFELSTVDMPAARPSRHAAAIGHLVSSLRAIADGDGASYELGGLGRVAHHLRRVNEIGAAVDAANLDDLAEVLGHRPDADHGDEELLDLVARAGPEREAEIVRLLDARAQRLHLEMASPTSLMVRHPRLRTLRSDRPSHRDPSDGWPGGAIPGTA